MDPEFTKKMKKLPMVVTLGDTSQNKTGSWSLMKPQFVEKAPPCQVGCPAHVPLREIMTLVKEKNFEEAARIFVEAHPFPAITGRVCHHPCQSLCLRGGHDGALEIRQVERFISSFVKAPVLEATEKEESIAVVGSGPAGLACAYYLRLRGYPVAIFESKPKGGGILRYGIPEYRLPEPVLDQELERLQKMGIEIKTNITVTARYIKEKFSQYRTIFLAIGAHKSKKIGVPGEELEGVLSGLAFLSNFEKYRDSFSGKKVAVIGGGNTAMDAARVALRLGAEVDILYRRTRQEMPAIQEEIEGALEENCNFHYLAAPVSVKKEGEGLSLTCIKMKLGEPDESGRRRPVPLEGSEFERPYSYILSAIGEDPDFQDFDNLVTLHWGAIEVNHLGKTQAPHIFAGGDAAGKDRTVVDALASGRVAASAMAYFMENKGDPELGEWKSPLSMDNINQNYFPKQDPHPEGAIPLEDRKKAFTEIHSTLNEEGAIKEAERCFTCGICTHCDNCVIFCPDFAVDKGEKDYAVREEYCKGCGICIQECPRGVLEWKRMNADF